MVIFFWLWSAIPLYWMVRSSFMKIRTFTACVPSCSGSKEMLLSNYTDALKAADFEDMRLTRLHRCGLPDRCFDVFHGGLCFFQNQMDRPGLLLCPGALHDDASRFRYPDPTVHDSRNFHMIGYLLALILPSRRRRFQYLPAETVFLRHTSDLDEAARIDGAGPLQIFFRDYYAAGKISSGGGGSFTFLGNWNDFFGPIIYLNTKDEIYAGCRTLAVPVAIILQNGIF